MGKRINKIWSAKKQIWLTLVVGVIACVFALLIIAFSHREYETIPLKEHWRVTFDSIDGNGFDDVSIGDIPFSEAGKEDIIYLSTVLPKHTIAQPELSFFVSHCAVDVYLDEQLIYSYGDEIYKEDGLLGSGYFFVPLPENYEGKTLSIRLEKVRESRFKRLEDICIISAEDAMRRLVTDNFLSVIIAIFLFIMCLIEFCSVGMLIRVKKPIRSMLSVSAFSLLMSFWLCCNNKTIQLFLQDYSKITFIEYTTLYFLPIGVLSLVYGFVTKPRYKKIVRVLVYWFLVFACTAVGTQVIHVFNLPEYVEIYWGSVLLTILLLLAFMIAERNVPRVLEEKIEMSGWVIFLLFAFVETIRYCLRKNYGFSIIGNQSLLPVGALVWIVEMLVRFVLAMYRSFVNDMRHNLLVKIAYTDSLTAINNRAKCEEVLQDYNENKHPILLVNMDLNGFKEVNDIYGHGEGDRLLCIFANILQGIFGEIATVGRMGGDEFIVIMDAEMETKVEEYICRLTQKVNEYNNKEKHPYLLQFAYGYATNEGDISVTPWDVYKKADEKMYRCKREQKMKKFGER